jgi:HK97 family phage prohead protease
MNRKDFNATGEVNGSTFKATISTESVDRDGEVMVPQGMNAKDYERNPVLLWNHDPSQPIGRALTLKRGDTSISAEFEFAKRPDDYDGDWFPDYVRGLVAAGVVKGVSIGFMPMEGGVRMATKGDSDRYGPDVRRVFSKWKLLEVSVVSVPANQDALISAVRKGFVTESAAKRFGSIATPQPAPPVQPVPKYVVSVRVPAFGTDAARRLVADEIAKARGRLVV